MIKKHFINADCMHYFPDILHVVSLILDIFYEDGQNHVK